MVTIRPATAADQERLGRFGGALMRQHHAADPKRFIQVENPEAGYGRFLVSQISNPNSLVMVAEHAAAVVGYVFADVEPTNWMELRGIHNAWDTVTYVTMERARERKAKAAAAVGAPSGGHAPSPRES